MVEQVLIVPLPDGSCAALDASALAAARTRAQELGFKPLESKESRASYLERWLTSRELAQLIGVGDTTLEAMAARGEIPHQRIGKALRFIESEVRVALKGRA